MGWIENLIALQRAFAAGLQAYRGAALRPEFRAESDYDHEIRSTWEDFQAFKEGRERERDEELPAETARLGTLGGDPQPDAMTRFALEQIRRRAREDIRQRGREAQQKAYALEREKNRKVRAPAILARDVEVRRRRPVGACDPPATPWRPPKGRRSIPAARPSP